jgi:dipeptidyl aminopeptidase/acylaminoacyl peptidase
MLRVLIASAFLALSLQTPVQNPPAAPQRPAPPTAEQIKAGHERDMKERQEVTDVIWRKASEGFMKMDKITYKSRVGGLTIPAFVFQPLTPRGAKGHPALVWVHPDIRGYVYEYYFPYVREAVSRGYVVIAPEYRGSYGYGQEHYDAIDYGGAEVDDVISGADYLKTMPIVDPDRIGIIGWSHGGMITLLAETREPKLFKAAVAMVPVSNLFQRLAWNGVEQRKQAIDPANRYGGLPHQNRQTYKDRSPAYQVDKIEIPTLVHITRNDTDVVLEEAMQLVDALRARKPFLAETKIYDAPVGGHLFDRVHALRPGVPIPQGTPRPDRMDLNAYTPTLTPELRDSWNRVWTFLDWNLRPYQPAK